jgi:hypothetical protein
MARARKRELGAMAPTVRGLLRKRRKKRSASPKAAAGPSRDPIVSSMLLA